MYNKSIVGLNQLKLVEFSGFLEKRRDPEIYHKHLFVHLNTTDLLGSAVTTSPSGGGGSVSSSSVPSSTSSSNNNNNNASNSESLIDDFEVGKIKSILSNFFYVTFILRIFLFIF